MTGSITIDIPDHPHYIPAVADLAEGYTPALGLHTNGKGGGMVTLTAVVSGPVLRKPDDWEWVCWSIPPFTRAALLSLVDVIRPQLQNLARGIRHGERNLVWDNEAEEAERLLSERLSGTPSPAEVIAIWSAWDLPDDAVSADVSQHLAEVSPSGEAYVTDLLPRLRDLAVQEGQA